MLKDFFFLPFKAKTKNLERYIENLTHTSYLWKVTQTFDLKSFSFCIRKKSTDILIYDFSVLDHIFIIVNQYYEEY